MRGNGSDGSGTRTGGDTGAGGGTGTGRTGCGNAGATRGSGSMRSVARGAVGGTGIGTTRSGETLAAPRPRGTGGAIGVGGTRSVNVADGIGRAEYRVTGAGMPLPARMVPGSTGAGRIEGGEGSAGGGATLRGI